MNLIWFLLARSRLLAARHSGIARSKSGITFSQSIYSTIDNDQILSYISATESMKNKRQEVAASARRKTKQRISGIRDSLRWMRFSINSVIQHTIIDGCVEAVKIIIIKVIAFHISRRYISRTARQAASALQPFFKYQESDTLHQRSPSPLFEIYRFIHFLSIYFCSSHVLYKLAIMENYALKSRHTFALSSSLLLGLILPCNTNSLL